MRICLYVGKAAPPEKQEEWLANAKSTCDVYASNLHREFTARGHEVVFASSLSARPADCSEADSAKRLARYEKMDFPEADHAVCLEQNGWRYRDAIFFEKARAATKGLICAICDHDHVVDGPQDFVFTARRPVHPSRARYIGWAAQPDVFTPDKDPEWLTIFIDHKYHAARKADETEALLKSATAYAARLAGKDRLVGHPPPSPGRLLLAGRNPADRARRGPRHRSRHRPPHLLSPRARSGARRVDAKDRYVRRHPWREHGPSGARECHRRGANSYPRRLRETGLAALARASRIYSVEHINWDALVDGLDPERFRRRALHFTWAQVAERMLETFSGREQESRAEPRREGDLLVAPPPAVADPRIARLGTWRTKNAVVQAHGDAERLTFFRAGPLSAARPRQISVAGDLYAELHGPPERPRQSGCLAVRANGRGAHGSALRPCRSRGVYGRTTNGWALLEATALRVGDEVLCQVVAHSDWAPILRCYLLLMRGDALEFEAEPDEPGLPIRRVQLTKGMGLIADISERDADARGSRAAAVG